MNYASGASLKLIQITNNPEFAQLADESGVDWVMIDLEREGKAQRQAGRDTVISNHSMEDVSRIRSSLSRARLVVRVNPPGPRMKSEVRSVIAEGAQIVMLPYYTTENHVLDFVEYVGGAADVCLLVETAEAVQQLKKVLANGGVDYVHVGLNDLHVSLRKNFMFEPLVDGTVESVILASAEYGVPAGFGGITALGNGQVPGWLVLSEHVRLHSRSVILSRGFAKEATKHPAGFHSGYKEMVTELRAKADHFARQGATYLQHNRDALEQRVQEVADGQPL